MSNVEVTINGEVFNLPEEMASKWHEQAKRVTSLAKRRAEELARIWGTRATLCDNYFDVEVKASACRWTVSFPLDDGPAIIYQSSNYSEPMSVGLMTEVCADVARACSLSTAEEER